MKNRLRCFAFALIFGSSYAQSNLPACQGIDTSRWSICFGETKKDDQHSYRGDFLNGREHGNGTMNVLAPNNKGDRYIGEFKYGVFNGRGTYIYSTGDKYVGEFRDGKRNGQGTHIYSNGDKYAGEFRNGKRNGQGTYTFADGRVSLGDWKDGKPHGRFIEYRADKSITRVGIFDDGKFIRNEDVNPAMFNQISPDVYPQLANTQLIENQQLKAEAQEAKRKLAEADEKLRLSNLGKALNAHALIIGNSSYMGSSKLPNPINDAKAMSGVLRSLGFTVTESLDADRTKLVTSLSQFSKAAANADITLLFYAGHGVQISGTNYMLPIDLNLNDLSQVPLQGVSLNSVVEQYLPGKTKLVFLDACRDNPLMQTASRSVSRGLAPINVSEGTLIAYSTKDGQVAQDGDGKNSPFTTALLQHLGDPDDIAVVLRKVREKVMKNTGGKQQPWEYGSLTGGALVLSAIKPIK